MTTSEEKKSLTAEHAHDGAAPIEPASAEPYPDIEFTQDALNDAVRAGDLNSVRHLIERGGEFGVRPNIETMQVAPRDRLDLLNYLLEASLKAGKKAMK